jgi:lipopolysaccharide transport system permease protein
MISGISGALADLGASLRLWRVWVALAHEDIGDQHRRTTLGPFWLLLNYLIYVGTFLVLFHRGNGTAVYAAHAATGLLVYYYIMETLQQSTTLFVREESFIKGTRLPLPVYVMRLTLQSLIRNAYALVGCLIILATSGVPLTLMWTASLLGMALIVLTTPAAITCLAFLGAYIPDSQYVVSNLLRVGMFLTPVFWMHDTAHGARAIFYWYNPFTYFIEIVRLPIIAGDMPWWYLALCCAMSVGLWVVALMLFVRLRKEVVFVL